MSRFYWRFEYTCAALLIAACQPADNAKIDMPASGDDSAVTVVDAAPVLWTCDGEFVEGTFGPESLTLHAGEQIESLSQTTSGSGARYVGAGYPPDTEFWIKGNEATFKRGQTVIRKCFVVDDPANPGSSVLPGTWDVSEIGSEPVLEGSSVSMTFESGGRLSGSNGCNRYGSQYKLSVEGLEIGLMQSTLMACPEALMEQEQRFSELLSQASILRFDGGDSLQLLTSDGQSITATRAP